MADLKPEDIGRQAEALAVRLKISRRMIAAPDASGNRAMLSSGERRRIALFKAVLENRPILVFDRWAADQDRRYKDFFDEEFLPLMRDFGKLVIAVSHDEQYFHHADRVLWLERGEPPAWRAPSSFGTAAALRPDLGEPDAQT